MLMTLALRGHRLRIKRLVRIAPGAKPGERAADLMGGEDLGDIPACLGRRRGAGESTLRRPRSMLLVGNYQAWTGDLPETREEPVVHPAKDPRRLARARVRNRTRRWREMDSNFRFRARSEPARRCPKDFGSSPSTVRGSAPGRGGSP